MLTGKQEEVLYQQTRRLDVKFDILNHNETVINSIKGKVTDGNITLDGDSAYRRNGSISMIVSENLDTLPSSTSFMWLTKRCSIAIGIEHYDGEMVWFPLGHFAFDDINMSVHGESIGISCTLRDYMAFLDGSLGGTFGHEMRIVAEEVTIREAILGIMKEYPKLAIDDVLNEEFMAAKVPYDIEKNAGTTAYDMLKELLDLYMGYEMFFDTEGYFVVRKVEDKRDDPIVHYFGDNASVDFTIDKSQSFRFSEVKNRVYVWGYLDDKTGEQTKQTYCNKYIRTSVDEMNEIDDMEDFDICTVVEKEKYTHYLYESGRWTEVDFIIHHQYCVENIGEKVMVFDDSNIVTDGQAQLRGQYELETKGMPVDTISITTIPLYHLLPNKKINIKVGELLNGDYIIKNLNIPLNASGTMSISAQRLIY